MIILSLSYAHIFITYFLVTIIKVWKQKKKKHMIIFPFLVTIIIVRKVKKNKAKEKTKKQKKQSKGKKQRKRKKWQFYPWRITPLIRQG
jgi:hypothetical protein